MRVDICVCTFRRPSVAETLRTLFAQVLPADVEARIIVVDNDARPTAEATVRRAAETAGRSVRYIHHPGQNISTARNAALRASTSDLVAFIDDDETAPENWLATLLSTMKQSGADVVLGPVVSTYGEQAPGWMQRTAPHATKPVSVLGEITTGYTCNVLFNRSRPPLNDLSFDEALGRSGGEDTYFFARAYKNGARIAYTSEAPVFEPVPLERARLSWLVQRRFRMGHTHALTLCDCEGFLPLREIGRAAAKVTYCAGAAVLSLPSPDRRNTAILRGALHAGVVSALFGGRSQALYGDTERPAS